MTDDQIAMVKAISRDVLDGEVDRRIEREVRPIVWMVRAAGLTSLAGMALCIGYVIFQLPSIVTDQAISKLTVDRALSSKVDEINRQLGYVEAQVKRAQDTVSWLTNSEIEQVSKNAVLFKQLVGNGDMLNETKRVLDAARDVDRQLLVVQGVAAVGDQPLGWSRTIGTDGMPNDAIPTGFAPGPTGEFRRVKRFTFPVKYKAVPQIVVALTGFNTIAGVSSIRVAAENVTEEGADIVWYMWPGVHVTNASATMMVVPPRIDEP